MGGACTDAFFEASEEALRRRGRTRCSRAIGEKAVATPSRINGGKELDRSPRWQTREEALDTRSLVQSKSPQPVSNPARSSYPARPDGRPCPLLKKL